MVTFISAKICGKLFLVFISEPSGSYSGLTFSKTVFLSSQAIVFSVLIFTSAHLRFRCLRIVFVLFVIIVQKELCQFFVSQKNIKFPGNFHLSSSTEGGGEWE